MPDDYLGDRSGEPDPEVERLEELLGGFRQDQPAPALPVTAAVEVGRLRRALPWLAAAAAILLAIAGGWLLLRRERGAGSVASLAGAPLVGAVEVRGTGRLAGGEWLETDPASRARVGVGMIREGEVEP